MKQLIYCVTLFALLTFIGCQKVNNKAMTVVKDCTGTYLNYNGNDYHVCNLEMVSSFANGAKVTVTFKKIKECTSAANDAIVCEVLHENNGWINVEKIK